MVINIPFIIFIYLIKLIKSKFINEENFTNNINSSNIQTNIFFNESNNKIKDNIIEQLSNISNFDKNKIDESIINQKALNFLNSINIKNI